MQVIIFGIKQIMKEEPKQAKAVPSSEVTQHLPHAGAKQRKWEASGCSCLFVLAQ